MKKNPYVNSRLHPLLIAFRRRPRAWLFSLGEPWLLLTPARLQRLAARLGLADERVDRLVGLVRRHDAGPEEYCRRLGIEESRYIAPADYPPAVCPHCDNVHLQHPVDAEGVCLECLEREQNDRWLIPGGTLRDRIEDLEARGFLRKEHPDDFDDGVLSPNHRINKSRRLDRDWDRAVNRILLGLSYRDVAREFRCSVGALHKKVHERAPWENN